MLSTTPFAFTVPLLTRGLSTMTAYMSAAMRHVESNGTDADVLFNARLAPDMQPLSSQVQMACDKAKNGVARLTGVVAPAFADTETTFEDLKARIAKTVAFLGNGDPARFEGADDREVELRFKGAIRRMRGHDYLTRFLLPDFYFHVATAHGILRHNGLALGKSDYIGEID